MIESDMPLDPEIQRYLELLVPVGPRDPQAARRGREQFLAEVDLLLPPDGLDQMIAGWFGRLASSSRRENLSPIPLFIVLMIVFALVFGGAFATASAAEASLPGDALYPLKTMVEESRLAISRNADAGADLHLQFAEKRLLEIEKLIAAGRFRDVPQAAARLEFHLKQAIDYLTGVSAVDPAKAPPLAEKIAGLTARYKQVLHQLLVLAPADLQEELRSSLLFGDWFGEITGEGQTDENLNDGGAGPADDRPGDNKDDNSDDRNANKNDSGDDNGDDNENGNENDDENDNDNENENDKENENQNLNESSDNDRNDDGSDKGEENENERDNDNVNENDNENEVDD
ncbi:MAG: DUF5667 domain-containing protein [Anaerolineales bacterium]|nr:DUF5667 domain-containing protein [Anaerolineales bacterium]